MAKEWYLMNSNHDTVSGFESDDFDYFSRDSFEEALQSSIGCDVELCNYDLSERTPIRAIMQGNVQDTKLNTLTRKMLVKIGTCKTGQYVFYKNRYWLITGLVDDNSIYEKAILSICSYLLTWLNAENKIIQRWANIISASQYNNGETTEKHVTMKSDQLMIFTPSDDESILIPHSQRFIIDKRCRIYEKKFSDNIASNTSNKLLTYQVTREDNVIYDYQDSGYTGFMVSQDEQHEKDGYYIIDGKGYWLCDSPKTNTPILPEITDNLLTCSIDYDEPVIYSGIEPNVFMAHFYNSNGDEIEITPQWEINNCDFAEKLNIEYIDNSIFISVDEDKLINKSFELSLFAENCERNAINVKIKAFI